MKKVKCFISYSHKDKRYLDEFQTHLEGLKRIVDITDWYDGYINAGEKIDEEVYKNMHISDIIFLLLSPNYIKSCYCFEKELTMAMQRYINGECLVIPILLKKVANLNQYGFSKYRITPPDAKAISTYRPMSDGFVVVMEDIYTVIKKRFLTKTPAPKPPVRKKIQTTSTSTLTFEVINRNKLVNKQLNKDLFIELKSYISKQALLEKRLTVLLVNSIIKFQEQYEIEKDKKQFVKWHKQLLESYSVQMLEYTKKIMNNSVCALHLRWLNNNAYLSFVDAGYKDIAGLSTHSLPGDDPMIAASFNHNMPIIKSLNTQLHNKYHNDEKNNKRDYITCAFSNIKKGFNEELTLCISCDNIDAKNAQTRLLIMSLCRIDIKIESFIQAYAEACKEIDNRFDLRKIGGKIS